ncbi:large conductance mechanosensitive channel protein MscL [Stieleria varia]|nr:large conductance mechanosensitive channel protein MscL [Stieleria varia]
MIKEFKEFALKGNMVDMAVAIVIGGAFATVVKSLVADIVTPPLGLLTENIKFEQMGITLRGTPGEEGAVVIGIGSFLNNMLSFLIVALAIFLLIKVMNNVRKRFEEEKVDDPTTKKCDACKMEIPIDATRCGHCTSDIPATAS